jgi:hypothetical protein
MCCAFTFDVMHRVVGNRWPCTTDQISSIIYLADNFVLDHISTFWPWKCTIIAREHTQITVPVDFSGAQIMKIVADTKLWGQPTNAELHWHATFTTPPSQYGSDKLWVTTPEKGSTLGFGLQLGRLVRVLRNLKNAHLKFRNNYFFSSVLCRVFANFHFQFVWRVSKRNLLKHILNHLGWIKLPTLLLGRRRASNIHESRD